MQFLIFSLFMLKDTEYVKNYCMGRKRNCQVGSSFVARQNLALVPDWATNRNNRDFTLDWWPNPKLKVKTFSPELIGTKGLLIIINGLTRD